MPTRLMDHLERYLKHARFDGPVPVDEPPPEECPRCHDQGYVRRDVPARWDWSTPLFEYPLAVAITTDRGTLSYTRRWRAFPKASFRPRFPEDPRRTPSH